MTIVGGFLPTDPRVFRSAEDKGRGPTEKVERRIPTDWEAYMPNWAYGN